MLACFVSKKANSVPIEIVELTIFADWIKQQDHYTQSWLEDLKIKPEFNRVSLVPNETGRLSRVLCFMSSKKNFWEIAHLPLILPEGNYHFAKDENPAFAVGWGLGAYQFTRYKQPLRHSAKLFLEETQSKHVQNMVESIYLVRDWINTPTDDLGPSELATSASALAAQYGAKFKEIVGENLLQQNYASIYTVGRASDDAPRLIDMQWGKASHPKVTLVGKGVCFDSGGLDIKSAGNMLLMKKDMGGAAHVFGLARMIMEAKLPICLRVLVPAVENVIAGNAYRPGDVIKSRKGLTIEIGNTDAEGRVILADALTEAVADEPDLLIDMATLTGAARVALGPDVPVVFSNNDEIVNALLQAGVEEFDLMWRLPLHDGYREYLNSQIADINNAGTEGYGGAITAALFLKEFVPSHIPWLHFDMMAWNLRPRPGKPIGGEAMAIRALFTFLSQRYQGNE